MQFLHSNYWLNVFKGGQNQPFNLQGSAPKVVLFVALFCIALFLVKNPEQNLSSSLNEIEHKRIGRMIQEKKRRRIFS